jgi:acetate kinase
MGDLLVINAGSSSIKLAVFDERLQALIRGQVMEIGGASRLEAGDVMVAKPVADHRAALAEVLQAFAAAGHPVEGFVAAAHRVVHGGAGLIKAGRVTPETIAAIEACVPLAPLHNPANLVAIRALAEVASDLPQYVSFDTAFHATNPDVATRYAIPAADAARGIRRYGFHGLSYAALVQSLPALSGAPLPRRLLAMHLGNGASLCAVRDGVSVATTMGYSPLDGLTMGTRAGAIDGNAVLRLAQVHGIDGAARILNREAGLLALGGTSDMRALSGAGTPEARFAVDHFCYWAVRHAGSMIAAMGGIDGIAFTGGIGENDHHVRARILDGLAWAGVEYDGPANRQGAACLHESGSRVAIWTVPAQEERQIAVEAFALMGMTSE